MKKGPKVTQHANTTSQNQRTLNQQRPQSALDNFYRQGASITIPSSNKSQGNTTIGGLGQNKRLKERQVSSSASQNQILQYQQQQQQHQQQQQPHNYSVDANAMLGSWLNQQINLDTTNKSGQHQQAAQNPSMINQQQVNIWKTQDNTRSKSKSNVADEFQFNDFLSYDSRQALVGNTTTQKGKHIVNSSSEYNNTTSTNHNLYQQQFNQDPSMTSISKADLQTRLQQLFDNFDRIPPQQQQNINQVFSNRQLDPSQSQALNQYMQQAVEIQQDHKQKGTIPQKKILDVHNRSKSSASNSFYGSKQTTGTVGQKSNLNVANNFNNPQQSMNNSNNMKQMRGTNQQNKGASSQGFHQSIKNNNSISGGAGGPGMNISISPLKYAVENSNIKQQQLQLHQQQLSQQSNSKPNSIPLSTTQMSAQLAEKFLENQIKRQSTNSQGGATISSTNTSKIATRKGTSKSPTVTRAQAIDDSKKMSNNNNISSNIPKAYFRSFNKFTNEPNSQISNDDIHSGGVSITQTTLDYQQPNQNALMGYGIGGNVNQTLSPENQSILLAGANSRGLTLEEKKQMLNMSHQVNSKNQAELFLKKLIKNQLTKQQLTEQAQQLKQQQMQQQQQMQMSRLAAHQQQKSLSSQPMYQQQQQQQFYQQQQQQNMSPTLEFYPSSTQDVEYIVENTSDLDFNNREDTEKIIFDESHQPPANQRNLISKSASQKQHIKSFSNALQSTQNQHIQKIAQFYNQPISNTYQQDSNKTFSPSSDRDANVKNAPYQQYSQASQIYPRKQIHPQSKSFSNSISQTGVNSNRSDIYKEGIHSQQLYMQQNQSSIHSQPQQFATNKQQQQQANAQNSYNYASVTQKNNKIQSNQSSIKGAGTINKDDIFQDYGLKSQTGVANTYSKQLKDDTISTQQQKRQLNNNEPATKFSSVNSNLHLPTSSISTAKSQQKNNNKLSSNTYHGSGNTPGGLSSATNINSQAAAQKNITTGRPGSGFGTLATNNNSIINKNTNNMSSIRQEKRKEVSKGGNKDRGVIHNSKISGAGTDSLNLVTAVPFGSGDIEIDIEEIQALLPGSLGTISKKHSEYNNNDEDYQKQKQDEIIKSIFQKRKEKLQSIGSSKDILVSSSSQSAANMMLSGQDASQLQVDDIDSDEEEDEMEQLDALIQGKKSQANERTHTPPPASTTSKILNNTLHSNNTSSHNNNNVTDKSISSTDKSMQNSQSFYSKKQTAYINPKNPDEIGNIVPPYVSSQISPDRHSSNQGSQGMGHPSLSSEVINKQKQTGPLDKSSLGNAKRTLAEYKSQVVSQEVVHQRNNLQAAHSSNLSQLSNNSSNTNNTAQLANKSSFKSSNAQLNVSSQQTLQYQNLAYNHSNLPSGGVNTFQLGHANAKAANLRPSPTQQQQQGSILDYQISFFAHNNTISCLELDPHHPDSLFSASLDQTVKQWDIGSLFVAQTPKRQEPHHYINYKETDESQSKNQNKGNHYLSQLGRSVILNPETFEHTLRLKNSHSQKVQSILFLDKYNILAAAGNDKQIKLHSMNDGLGTVVKTIKGGHQGVINSLCKVDGDKIVSACSDTKIRLFSLSNDSLDVPIATFVQKASGVTNLCTIDQHHILSSGLDRSIRYWDIRQQDPVLIFDKIHYDTINSIDRLSSHVFVSAADDSNINIWDLRMTKLMKQVRIENERVTCVKFISQNYLIAAHQDSLSVMSAKDNFSQRHQFNTPTIPQNDDMLSEQSTFENLSQYKKSKSINAMAYSERDRKLYTGGFDKKINVWSLNL